MPDQPGGGLSRAPLGVRLPPATLERLKGAAARLDRPVSWCVRKAVEEWLDRQGRKR